MARVTQGMTYRENLVLKEKAGRSNLLLAIILTVINVVMLVAGGNSMLLFSISVPYYAVIFGMILGGQELMITGCVIAAVMLLAYFLCWLLSKKRPGWLIAALVLFIVDTLGLVAFYLLAGEVSGILDFVFHALIIYYLVASISATNKLKKLPPEEPEVVSPVAAVVEAEPVVAQEEENV